MSKSVEKLPPHLGRNVGDTGEIPSCVFDMSPEANWTKSGVNVGTDGAANKNSRFGIVNRKHIRHRTPPTAKWVKVEKDNGRGGGVDTFKLKWHVIWQIFSA
uniref:HDC02460 n=1 Tax=Drosophila melanogaster TaxID=7227 RepID=Q6IHJ8_DROME|nr:TPA_inf: HDC02460 [Drosophila melanogaster]